MRADWIECGLEGERDATILMELKGSPEEIEQIRQMTRRARGWTAKATGRAGDPDRIVLKMEEEA